MDSVYAKAAQVQAAKDTAASVARVAESMARTEVAVAQLESQVATLLRMNAEILSILQPKAARKGASKDE